MGIPSMGIGFMAIAQGRELPMRTRCAAVAALALVLSAAAIAQDQGAGSGSASPDTQNPGSQDPGGQGQGGGYGRRGGRGGFGMGMMGRGLTGTVTEAAADHFTVKSFSGEIYTVRFNSDTRMMKQRAGMRGPGQGNGGDGSGPGQARGEGRGFGGNPPEPIKASDIKVGDAITSMGETDAAAKTVTAAAILLVDPERARQMQEMQANYGKTWLMGRVTAIDGVKVTVTGAIDNAPHSFVADENTTFRRRRDPITLADMQVGDVVRADGALKDGVFTATTVSDLGGMQGGPVRVPGNGQSPAQPQ